MPIDEDIFKAPKSAGLLAGQNQPLTAPAPPVKTTAANKDWDKGSLRVTDDGVYFTPPPGKTPAATGAGTPAAGLLGAGPGQDTVEGRLTGLLSSGSPYIETAKTQAANALNRRGLLNSTMAGTAGEKAAIESALPIAQQDAGYFQNRGLQAQQGEIQTGLYKTQGEISSELQASGAEQASELSAQQIEQNKVLKEADMEWNKLDLQARMDVEFARMDEANKTQFNETVNAIQGDYANSYLEVMLNPNFETPEDRQAALNVINENTKNRFDTAAAIAQVELTWTIPESGKLTKYTGGTVKPENMGPATGPPPNMGEMGGMF